MVNTALFSREFQKYANDKNKILLKDVYGNIEQHCLVLEKWQKWSVPFRFCETEQFSHLVESFFLVRIVVNLQYNQF